MPRQGRRAVCRRARGARPRRRPGVRAVTRDALKAALDGAVGRLVARAAVEQWPIRADHCFLRVAYDAAVGAKWDTVFAGPAWRTLPPDRLAVAVAVLDRIDRDGRTALDPLNASSLAFRRAAR